MTPTEQLEAIFQIVRTHGEYIERDHKTMGGMWTVDTWVLGDIRVQLMDEGSTQAVLSDNFNAYSTYGREVTFIRGGAQELETLYAEANHAVTLR